MKHFLLLLGFLAGHAAIAAEPAFDPWERRINAEGILELEWDDLIPSDFDPDKVFMEIAKRYDISELEDGDPRAEEIQAEVREVWNNAPVVESLDGRRVKLPGLVVPLEGDGEAVSEFLLVPYYGACIHVPPPPSNQIVYVRTGAQKARVHEMFEAVWVVGTLRTEHQHQSLADASYTLHAESVEPYE